MVKSHLCEIALTNKFTGVLQKLFFVILSSLVFQYVFATNNDSLIVGTWKGTSICQIITSPCHDEIAVYHITKGEQPGTYHFVMNKVVKEKEEDMAVLDYVFDAKAGTYTNSDEGRRATWSFKVKGDSMEGTLYYRGQLYRIIKLKRSL